MFLVYEGMKKVINLDKFETIEVIQDGDNGFFVGACNVGISFDYNATYSSILYKPTEKLYITRLTSNMSEECAVKACSHLIDEMLSGSKYIRITELEGYKKCSE